MKIQVLGTGCTKCQLLTQHVITAIKELDIAVEFEKVESIAEIMQFGVMSTPALVINGTIVLTGRIANVQEIKNFIAHYKE